MRRTSIENLKRHSHKNKPKQNYYHNYKPSKISSIMKFLVVLFIIFILVAAAALASILFFNRQSDTVNNRLIELKMQGPDEVISGQRHQFYVSLLNKEISDLKTSELTIKFPSGFNQISVSQPCTEELQQGCVWSLGKIKRNDRKTLEIEGIFFESTDSAKFEVLFNFSLANLTSTFKKEIQKDIVVKPVLLTTLFPPTNFKIGQKDDWQLKIRNVSDSLIENIKVIIESPKDLMITLPFIDNSKIQILSDIEKGWLITELLPQEEKIFIFEASFLRPVESPYVQITAGLLANEKKQFFIQNIVKQEITLESADISLSLATQSDKSKFKLGETVYLNLVYQNLTSPKFKNAIIDIQINPSQYFNWSEIRKSNWQWTSGQSSVEANTWQIESMAYSKQIRFSKIQIPALAEILSQQQGTIKLRLDLLEIDDLEDKLMGNLEIKFEAKIRGNFQSQAESTKFISHSLGIEIENNSDNEL